MKELYVVQQNIIDNKINLKTLIIENFTQKKNLLKHFSFSQKLLLLFFTKMGPKK